MNDLFRIKPLEWEWFEATSERGWKASSSLLGEPVLVHQIQNIHYKEWIDKWWVKWPNEIEQMLDDSPPILVTSPEEGKQLAEAHWQEFIKQALVPVETNE